jgi:putative transposase
MKVSVMGSAASCGNILFSHGRLSGVSTMTFDPDKHHRRSIRLEDYDYSWAGAYFVTICVQHLACLFGEICNDQVIPNPAGIPVQSEWDALPRRFPSLELDAFVLMPNHVHGIVVITEETWTSADVDPRTRAARVRDPDVGATLV